MNLVEKTIDHGHSNNERKKSVKEDNGLLQINGNEWVPDMREIWFQAALDIADY